MRAGVRLGHEAEPFVGPHRAFVEPVDVELDGPQAEAGEVRDADPGQRTGQTAPLVVRVDPDDEAQSARARAALPKLFELTLSLGGTLSGEHGVGVAKRDFMAHAFDTPTLAAMRAVKMAFDPDGILNPGKVLPP